MSISNAVYRLEIKEMFYKGLLEQVIYVLENLEDVKNETNHKLLGEVAAIKQQHEFIKGIK